MGDVFLIFGINWVMPGTVAALLFCWRNWFGKHGSVKWNVVLGRFNVDCVEGVEGSPI